jgi:predicted CopG family antitoxin
MTTVTISGDTHRKLKKLKEKLSADSFDSMLEDIANEKLEVPSTDEMFGSAEIKDKEKIRDRNDRTDRYE